MKWSPDGYVLAVGFVSGWAIWSVGGRCLVWGFLEESQMLSPRYIYLSVIPLFDLILARFSFEDSYMQGIRDLVGRLTHHSNISNVTLF